MTGLLRGVIAAITTPITSEGEPDVKRLIERAHRLLQQGCDGLNLLGTTGEATSLSVAQRAMVMRRISAEIPTDRLMVGTGTSAIADTVQLTHLAAALGFAGALVLPPFYYKPVTDEGILSVFDRLVAETEIPLYLYNFPALSGVLYSPELVAELVRRFGGRIAGLKDSSGDMAYARRIAAESPSLAVFPSNEANLLQTGADGPFAGCISATANLNAAYCAAAFHRRDEKALAAAVAVRRLFESLPLIPAIKALVGLIETDSNHARPLPPLTPLGSEALAALSDRYHAVLKDSPLQEQAL